MNQQSSLFVLPDPESCDGSDQAEVGPSIGEAGEYLALSRLLGWGLPASKANPRLKYDLIVPHADRFCRIQVKAARICEREIWTFTCTRGWGGGSSGKTANRGYQADDYDICAFVAVGIGYVLFEYGVITDPIRKFNTGEFRAYDAERKSWLSAMDRWKEAE